MVFAGQRPSLLIKGLSSFKVDDAMDLIVFRNEFGKSSSQKTNFYYKKKHLIIISTSIRGYFFWP